MNPDTVRLLREAAQWRLLGLLFECPQAGWQPQLAALAGEAGDHALQRAVDAACHEGSIELYSTIFGPGGPAAPREVSYREMTIPGQIFGELRTYYRAFGYEPSCGEAPDHIAVELGFVAYLRLKEAYARERQNPGEADVAAEAATRFIADHLAPMAVSLAENLARSDVAYFVAAGEALRNRIMRATAPVTV
ncbi:MAG: molecular chaperone TorD family protein [Candidatus Zixiibacteriota bacterium]